MDKLQMTPQDAQRALLEIVVRMAMTQPMFKKYTHLRYNSGHWQLINADDNGVYAEREINMGRRANDIAELADAPYNEPGASITRMTVRFNPPMLSIDVLDKSNNPLKAERIIDTEMEHRLQQELLSKLRSE